VHKDWNCHLCPEGKFEVKGGCSDCPAKQVLEMGMCVCAEAMNTDGSCYLCSEIKQVFDKDLKTCVPK